MVSLQAFVVDVFFALEIRTFGSGGNPFAQRLDHVGVEGFGGLGDAADETGCGAGSFAAEGEVCIKVKEWSCPVWLSVMVRGAARTVVFAGGGGRVGEGGFDQQICWAFLS